MPMSLRFRGERSMPDEGTFDEICFLTSRSIFPKLEQDS
jgi:hypothetical protein